MVFLSSIGSLYNHVLQYYLQSPLVGVSSAGQGGRRDEVLLLKQSKAMMIVVDNPSVNSTASSSRHWTLNLPEYLVRYPTHRHWIQHSKELYKDLYIGQEAS